MNKFELMYGLGAPKPAVLQMTDSEFTTKTPMEILADVNTTLKAAWGCSEPHYATIAIPTQKTLRKVHHFKGRRYVVRYSMFDVFNGWFK